MSNEPAPALGAFILASSLLVFASPAMADKEIVIWLEPMDGESAQGTFRMRIVDPPENLSTLWFHQYVTRYVEVDGGLAPVSELAISFSCTQGISICGPFLEGGGKFHPTEIFLDKDLKQLPGGDLCELKYLFTYPAYYYLANFNWEADNPDVTYFDSQRLPPDFIGIERWVVVDSNC